MADPIRIKPTYTLAGLQTKLGNVEAAFVVVKALETDGNDTIAMVEDVDARPAALQLLLDPAGNVPAPAGTTLVCRGEVFIQSNKQKVAAFRSNG